MREDCENVKWAKERGKERRGDPGWNVEAKDARARKRERGNNPSVCLARQLNACHIMR